MRSRTLLVLAAAVVVLGGFILLHERHLPTTDEAGERADRVFPGLTREDVATLEVSNRHGSFRLDRTDDGWRVTAPRACTADRATVDRVLGSLVDLTAERSLAADEADRDRLGLGEPEIEVVLHTVDDERLRLAVGAELPLGARRPVARPGGDVVICKGGFATGLATDLDGWRSRDVVDVFSDQVVAITVDGPAGRAHAVREGRLWRLVEPRRDLADRDHITSLVTDLNTIQVESFADGVDPAELGLDEPRHTVTLVREGADGAVVLDFGAIRDQDGSTRVACRRDDGEPFWVGDGAELRLAKPPVLWRSRAVYPFDSWNATSLSLSSGTDTADLVREAGVWRFADGAEADTAEAASRLSVLADLEASEFDLVDVGARELGRVTLGLRPPAADEDADEVSLEYVFSAPLAAGGDAAVRVSGRDGLMGVSEEQVEQLLGDLAALMPAPAAEIGDDGGE